MNILNVTEQYDRQVSARYSHSVGAMLAAVLVVFACIVAMVPASAYAEGGSLAIKSTTADGVEYKAVKIATHQGLPVDEAFDWSKLASDGLEGQTLPKHDANRGRDLVMAVSTIVAVDEDGSISRSLESYLASNANSVSLLTNGEAVSVDDGWYLITSVGKRSVFAWVEGEALTVGDKASIPTAEKTVQDAGKWGSTGFFGQGESQSYRIDAVIPDSYDGYTKYRLTFHDNWDEGLSYVEGSATVVFVHDNVETDITSAFEISCDASARTLAASASDIKAAGVSTGDTVRLSYTMKLTKDALGKPGLVNSAYVSYPSFDGDGTTVKTSTRVFTFACTISKVDIDDTAKSLPGARFAIMNSEAKWLQEDGTFGDEGTRLVLATADNGVTSMTPGLADGKYTLVEIEAPKGYELPQVTEMAFSISASTSGNDLELKVEGTSPASIVSTDAATSTFAMQVADEKSKTRGGDIDDGDEDGDDEDSRNPIVKTGDYLLAHPLVLAGIVVLLLAIAAGIAVARRRRDE